MPTHAMWSIVMATMAMTFSALPLSPFSVITLIIMFTMLSDYLPISLGTQRVSGLYFHYAAKVQRIDEICKQMYLKFATRFCSFLADCRRSLPLSPQPHSKVRRKFSYLPKPPYLCAQLINSINIKNLKIMKQQNEMSARALTMEEMENVNGGFLPRPWHKKHRS